ncbi:hypothetical protein JXA63_03140 [Candidatus Woesebacteria bacterium]|nr:hypothetical protein [Candidatus Woesebacteria bacterium]
MNERNIPGEDNFKHSSRGPGVEPEHISDVASRVFRNVVEKAGKQGNLPIEFQEQFDEIVQSEDESTSSHE